MYLHRYDAKTMLDSEDDDETTITFNVKQQIVQGSP